MVEISFNIDENNKVTAFFTDNLSGNIKLEVDDSIVTDRLINGTPYKYIDGSLVVDVDKQEYEALENQVLELQQKLNDPTSVDSVTEALEYKLRDESIPTNLQQVLDDRQSWREQIVTLQEQMSSLN